jgi:hypothetical protein
MAGSVACSSKPLQTTGGAGSGGAGSSGVAGTSGSGTAGSSGAAGTGGSSGAAGTGGGSGAAGTGGGSGATGMAGSSGAAGAGGYFQDLSTATVRKFDLLFMVDNSSSMEKSQANLQANLPRFMDVLKGLPGGLPDVHIAVISSDMGAGNASGDIPNCNASDNGIFHSNVAVRSGCTSTGLMPGATFIASTGGQNPVNNFTGDITQVFQCIAPLGAAGCGYEHQLASVVRALGADGFAVPAQNQDFLRPDANLGIVLLTNEDDCSSPDPDFYATSPNTIASPLGPSGNFRCAEFGHLCTRGNLPPERPMRDAPNAMVTDTVTYNSCVSAEGQGQLTPVATFAAQIKNLKVDPAAQILVASIQGPATPYEIHWKNSPTTGEPPWPDPTHSCLARDSSFADPGVRLQEFVQQFGTNGVVASICEDSFGPVLAAIATKLGEMTGPRCVGGLRDKDLTQPGLQPNCMVLEDDVQIPACANNGSSPPCWQLAPPSACPVNKNAIEVLRGATPPSSDALLRIRCETCPSSAFAGCS